MTKIIMHGCSGAMGQVITNLAKEREDVDIVAGIDVNPLPSGDYPVFNSLKECGEEADVIVDFSSAKAVDSLLDYCGDRGMALVLCTTGLSAEQEEKVRETAKKAAILRSANMSLGINTLLKLVQDAARILAGAGFDMEILERHHNKKVDAPSGTALALADALNEAMGGVYHYQYDRTARREKRDSHEIGIQSIRGGSIVGDHDVIFAGIDEVVTISHSAYSKAVFAKGAIEAARFLKGKAPGLYAMADVVASSR